MFSSLFSLPIAAADGPDLAVRDDDARAPESFFAGPENALVRSLHKAAVTELVTYNPVVLYGPAGAGKSAIAHSLAAIRREHFSLTNVIATTAGALAQALAHAVDTASIADLRSRYHRCDLLLVDDVHRLKGKPAAQQFLLTALDALVHRGSWVILTLRPAPQAAPGLANQLVSRLLGGLVTRIALPGQLARRTLVQQTAERIRLPLADEQITQLAGRGEGADSRYLTAAKLKQAVLKLAADHEFGAGRTAADSVDPIAFCRQISVAVAKHSGLTLGELRSKSRRQAIAEARSLAMFLARRLTGVSYAQIGRQFGNRDHTTVLHACRKVSRIIDRDEYVRRLADDLAAQIASEGVS